MRLSDPILPRWWYRFIIALLWALMLGQLGCVRPAPTPPAPARMAAAIGYDPSISRLIIPRDYNGGVWLCAEDVWGLTKPACVPLQQFRQFAQEFRNAD